MQITLTVLAGLLSAMLILRHGSNIKKSIHDIERRSRVPW
jgi:hypothetical protein